MADPDVPTNWSDALRIRYRTTATTPQDVGLPALDSIRLYPIKRLRKGDKNFEGWHRAIIKALQVNKLHRLVEIQCPRPAIDENWETSAWLQLSLLVKAWIGRCMEQDLLDTISNHSEESDFADIFMNDLRKAFRGEGIVVQLAAHNALLDIRRVDYSSTEEYLNHVHECYTQAEIHGWKVDACAILGRVVVQLGSMPHLNNIMQVLIMRIPNDVRSDIVGSLTKWEFHELMDKWKNVIKPLEHKQTSQSEIVAYMHLSK